MASTNGRSGGKLEFRTSTLKTTTKFYKDIMARKLTDENFKWPECPIKFITRNSLIGTIESPNRELVDFVENDEPESPSSAQLQQMPIFHDMAKRINNDPKEKVAPKMETQAVADPFLPHQPNQLIPNISPMVEMATPTQHVRTLYPKYFIFTFLLLKSMLLNFYRILFLSQIVFSKIF